MSAAEAEGAEGGKQREPEAEVTGTVTMVKVSVGVNPENTCQKAAWKKKGAQIACPSEMLDEGGSLARSVAAGGEAVS